MFWLLRIGGLVTVMLLGQLEQQLQIVVRHSDGTAVIGETATLEQLPDMTEVRPPCVTDEVGQCSWHVPRGLYQVRFERPLDLVTALALAEGGLTGFGLTVGDAPVVYHFVLHTDNQMYFDAAPERPLPQPIMPSFAELHGGYEATATAVSLPTETTLLETAVPSPTSEEVAVVENGRFPWPLLAMVASGLLLGGIVHLWTRHAKRPKARLPQGGQDA